MPKAKYWCFTSFSEVGPELSEGIKYLTYQKERCPSSGKTHFQGYLELKVSGTQGYVKTLTGIESHVEPSRSEAAIAYCHKEESRVEGPWEFGSRSAKHGRGVRSDLNEFGKRARERGGAKSIADSDPGMYIRYNRGFDAIRAISIKDRDRSKKPDVRVYIGACGSGKTRSVYDEYGPDEIYSKDPSSEWWNGYDGQKVILFDDFLGCEKLPIEKILTVCDRYPCQVQTKHGHARLGDSIIIFTTTVEIETWYQCSSVKWSTKIQDFMRRVSEVRRFTCTPEI